MAAWFRAADALVVTSLADGMNLVAKEFVAARGDLGGDVDPQRVRRRRTGPRRRAHRQPVRHRGDQARTRHGGQHAAGRKCGPHEDDARCSEAQRRAPLGTELLEPTSSRPRQFVPAIWRCKSDTVELASGETVRTLGSSGRRRTTTTWTSRSSPHRGCLCRHLHTAEPRPSSTSSLAGYRPRATRS